MALMTSCPACSTRFKVVPDQLRLHHGLVRCGTCDHVFDANIRLEAIVDDAQHQTIIVDAPDEGVSSQAWINKPAVQALVGASSNPLPDLAWTQIQDNAGKDRLTTQHRKSERKTRIRQDPRTSESTSVLRKRNTEPANTLATPTSQILSAFNDSERYKHLDSDDVLAMQAAARQQERRQRRAEKKRAGLQAALDLDSAGEPQATTTKQGLFGSLMLKKWFQKPSKRALSHTPQHHARSKHVHHTVQSVGVSLSLAGLQKTVLLCVLTLAALGVALQTLTLSRYLLADAWPMTKPALNKLCQYANCTVEPAIWLQPLSLDALSLSKLAANQTQTLGMQAYRVQATVRNSSHLWVIKPDIELTISNAQSSVIARRTLPASWFKNNLNDLNSSSLSTAEPLLEANSPLQAQGQTHKNAIKPGTDWQIDTVLILDEQTVGYTARVVYLPKVE